jgi:hypothetical protein
VVGWRYLPRQYSPFAPLHVADPLTLMTEFKLRRLRNNAEYCSAALLTAPLRTVPRPDAGSAECPLPNAVQVQAAMVPLSSSFLASCPLAVSYALWERHVLQPLAKQHFGQDIRRVTHLGSYACRNVNRGEGAMPGAPRSRHATADAFDVAGFVLADGRRVNVRRDWHTDASNPSAALLNDAHLGACRFFRGVLGPEYNAAHRDHFHLETGGFPMCR